ncbi:FAD-dependent monooxygenase [Amycolatopsis australiensis]|uniref:FAD-dependent monooxygenase n=1 Tax=Amycolatopsis australiensis TaxID=546364 RepID=UPI000B301E62|nr:FAD-dependent monooxygenase [Amycolatopsis australiensis]
MTDVLIAGAGPTGLLLAGELAVAGVEVTVLNRRDGPGLPRPVGLQPRTAELLDLRGLKPADVELDGPSGHFAGLPVALDPSVWRTRHPRVRNRTQDDVEALLADHAVKHGAVLRRGHEVRAAEAGADGVTVDGLRARWLGRRTATGRCSRHSATAPTASCSAPRRRSRAATHRCRTAKCPKR